MAVGSLSLASARGGSDVRPILIAPAALADRDDAALQALLTPFFAGKTSAQAYAALDAAGAPCEIVRETSWVQEALWEDWAIATNRVIENRQSMYGHVREFGLFMKLSETPGFARGSAPRLGEHTREILGEIGYSAAEIDKLIAERKATAAVDVTGRVDSKVSA